MGPTPDHLKLSYIELPNSILFSFLSSTAVLAYYNTLVLLRMLSGATVSALTVYALLRDFASLFALFVALGHDVPSIVMSY